MAKSYKVGQLEYASPTDCKLKQLTRCLIGIIYKFLKLPSCVNLDIRIRRVVQHDDILYGSVDISVIFFKRPENYDGHRLQAVQVRTT